MGGRLVSVCSRSEEIKSDQCVLVMKRRALFCTVWSEASW